MVELNVLAPIVATILSLVVTGIGVVLWHLLKRVRRLESDVSRQGRSIWGDEKDERHNGIADDVDKLERSVRSAKEAIEDIESYLEEINGYAEKYGDD